MASAPASTTSATAPALPGPRPTRIFGHNGNLLNLTRDRIATITTLYQIYGAVAALVQGDPRRVFAFGPMHNQHLLTNLDLFHHHYPAPISRFPVLQRLSAGLLFMNGEEHHQQRRLLAPAFHKQHVESYQADMIALTQGMLQHWRVGQPIDLAHAMQQLTLRIVTKTLFGMDIADKAENIGGLIQRWMTSFASVPVTLFPVDLPGTPYHRMLKLAERLEATILALIRQKREHLDTHRDVLALLIRAGTETGSALSDTALIGQVTTLFLAGHESSANALTWTLFLLTQHPKIYADLIDEIQATLRGATPTPEHLNRLHLLDSVVKESLRLLPPAIYNHRRATAPFTLGPYALPAGAVVTYSPYITHRIPELYAEPTKFLPERWATLTPSPYEYLPFGAGPRLCIGMPFALLEIKTVLATILSQYQLSIQPNAQIDRHVRFTLTPKHGMPMQVRAKNHRPTQTAIRGNIHEMVDLKG